VSIRNTLISVFLLLLLLLGALVWVSWRVVHSQAAVAEAESRRFESWKLADQLRQSSDDLTQLARLFVMTGDPRYERWFNEVLAIRNGEAPRPEGYDGIYWDFVLAGGQLASASGGSVSLDELMRRAGFTEEEFALLLDARQRSDALVDLEATAMNAVSGRFRDSAGEFTRSGEPDLDLARSIMHGREYLAAKAEIMRPIAQFFSAIDARTAGEVSEARAAAARDARLVIALVLLSAVVAALSFGLLLRLTLVPIRRMTLRLRDISAGEGDLTARVEEGQRNELGELAGWFNAFIGVVETLVSRVAGIAREVAAEAQRIASATAAQRASAAELSGSSSQIAVAVTEISVSGQALARASREVRGVASGAAAVAGEGQAGLRQMERTTEELVQVTAAVMSKLDHLAEQAAGIGGILSTIVRVADQTNLLSINAALEAEKAREHGAGFRVVSSEIRHLADQTAAATLRIERDVRAMQSAMGDGRSEMDRLVEHVRSVVSTSGRVTGQVGEVITGVCLVSQRLEEVDEGITQQAAGIEQITEAIGALNETAARGAQSAEEVARSSRALGAAVESLEREMGRFRVREPGAMEGLSLR